ncbi:MAG TPA: TrmH family RNA methyltransferase [Patescibacteria group bacterium]|nr:TrmH family RNA methyltransferase [Patescibacteria group bacterium]
MIVIAHNIRSLHNVGSIFRSCDVFGVEKVYLSGITGVPPRKEIAKVALGSEHRVAWEHVDEILELIGRLKKEGYQIVALENGVGAQPIDAFVPTPLRPTQPGFEGQAGPLVLILGNEVDGIDPAILDQCDARVEIAMPGRKQSLNVSVATGIALFALTRRPG